ncbi:NAD(P)/FAD-dependent oxidoreductase, partial [Streptococcus pyogenes]
LIDGIALFDYHSDGIPTVLNNDESSIQSNCFLIGPSLRQSNTIFCYIYKFRQRFVPIILDIAAREGWNLDPQEIQFFKENQMCLDNLD